MKIVPTDQIAVPDINVPRKGLIPVVNYWRALQILKQTPFKELWVKAREEAPHLLAIFLVCAACLFSVVFTVVWFIKKTLELLYSVLKTVVSFFVKR